MKKIKIIDNSYEAKCKTCKGKGCNRCKNGIWKDGRFYLIATQQDGTKIAFDVDQAGK